LDDKPADKEGVSGQRDPHGPDDPADPRQLSAMADHKASILMGATFVIFTITIGQARQAEPPIPLLILGAAAFFSAVFAVLAICRRPIPADGAHQPALLRFLHSACRRMNISYASSTSCPPTRASTGRKSRDIYQNGLVLERKKYRCLG
jgi:hypothetical protein